MRPKHIEAFAERAQKADALVLGPGMGTAPETVDFVEEFVARMLAGKTQLVIDADALNCLAQLRSAGKPIRCPGTILTPHPGEMARLLATTVREVQSDRYGAAQELAKLTGATVILKGAATIIADQEQGWVNTSGNPWLAVPGSGDILSGVIASLLARGFLPAEAACAAVLLHGRAGDLLEQQGAAPFLAGDIAHAVARLVGEESRQP